MPSLRRTDPAGSQIIPINEYETKEDLTIVAAVPGLQPEDIFVDVTESKLIIRTCMRGNLEDTKNYLRHEWHYGPYSRSIDLPFPVNAAKANAAYGGGVLTITLPKSKVTHASNITLQRIAPARGEAAHHGAAEFAEGGHKHASPRRETTPLVKTEAPQQLRPKRTPTERKPRPGSV